MTSNTMPVTEKVREMADDKYVHFIKTVLLLVQTGCFVLRNVLKTFVQNKHKTQPPMSFESFLNRESVKCELFHLGMKQQCCVCNKKHFDKQLSEFKWKALYMFTTSREITCGKNYIKGLDSHCCLYTAGQDVLNRLDISLMCFLILNISDFDKSEKIIEMIKELREIRNNTFAHAFSTCMSKAKFDNLWYDSCKIFEELARFTRDISVINGVQLQITEIEQLMFGRVDTFSESLEILQQSFQVLLKTQRIQTTLERGHLDDLTTIDGIPNGCRNLTEISAKIDKKIKQLQKIKHELCDEINKETSRLKFSDNIQHRGDTTTLVILGRSGSGKSKFANQIAEKEYFECPLSLHCTTNEIKKLSTCRQGRAITLIDTPDLFDEQTKTTIERENANHAAFYLCVVPLGMKTYSDKHVLEILKQYSVYDKLIIVFTDVFIKDKNTIESMIKKLPRGSSLGEMLERCQNRYIILEHNRQHEIPGKVQAIFDMMAGRDSSVSNDQNIDMPERKGNHDKRLSGNLEIIFRGLEIPRFLPELQEDIALVENIPEDRKLFYKEKVSAMLQEKQQLEDELKIMETRVNEIAHSALPTVKKSVFTEMKELPSTFDIVLEETKVFLRDREEERTDILEEKHLLTKKLTELCLKQNSTKENEMPGDIREVESIGMLKEKVEEKQQKLDDMDLKIESTYEQMVEKSEVQNVETQKESNFAESAYNSHTLLDVGDDNDNDSSDVEDEHDDRSNDDVNFDIADKHDRPDLTKRNEYQMKVGDNDNDNGGVGNIPSDSVMIRKQKTGKYITQTSHYYDGSSNNDNNVDVDDEYKEFSEGSNLDRATNNNAYEERDKYQRKDDENDNDNFDNEPTDGVLMRKQKTTNFSSNAFLSMESKSISKSVNRSVSPVAVIEFGLRHASYAYFRYHGDTVVTSIWMEGNQSRVKMPTSILLTADKKFHSFGFEAENKYRRLKQERKHRYYHYFHRISRWLEEYQFQRPAGCAMIEDENKIKVEAEIVFSLAIKYLTEQFQELVNLLHDKVSGANVYFVLVVPERHDVSMSWFLRQAVDAAGINANQLAILHQSKIAWIFYMSMHAQPYNLLPEQFRVGTKCLLLHQGASDMEVHLVTRGNISDEIVLVTKYPVGWKPVDTNKQNCHRKIVFVDDVREIYPGFYKTFTRVFGFGKHNHSRDPQSDIMDSSLIPKDIPDGTLTQIVGPRNNELSRRVLAAVTHCLDAVYKYAKTIWPKEIIMTGAFSQNEIVKEAIEKQYPGKIVRFGFNEFE